MPAVDASVVADGVTYEVTDSRSGTQLDADEVRAALAAATDSAAPADVRLELSAAVVPPLVTTEAAESRGRGRACHGQLACPRDSRRGGG